MTKASIKTFQQQKMYTAVQDSQLSEEEKVKRFDESFKALTDLSASILLTNILFHTMILTSVKKILNIEIIRPLFIQTNRSCQKTKKIGVHGILLCI